MTLPRRWPLRVFFMERIRLTQGKFALIDDEDLEKLVKIYWHCVNGYAKGIVDGKAIPMHRFLLNAPKDLQVDHIDGDKLNNQKSNLRLCTNQQNSWNREKGKRGKTSSYKGVNKNKRSGKWQARIQISGNKIELGQFLTGKEAALAYNEAAKKYHGEFARLNII